MASPTHGTLDGKRFAALAEELRKRPAAARVVDQLRTVETELRLLRKEQRGYKEIWELLTDAGLRTSYAHSVKAMRELLEGNVRPLEAARSRTGVRRGKVPVPPVTLPAVTVPARPLPIRMTPAPAPAVPASGDARARALGRSALDMEAERIRRR